MGLARTAAALVVLSGALGFVGGSWAGDCVAIDDFSRTKVGEFPAEWKPRKDAGREVYTVLEERALRFLRAVSRGLGIQAARPFEWDLTAYPVLSWQWRPLLFPAGADERAAQTNDSALAVYAVVAWIVLRDAPGWTVPTNATSLTSGATSCTGWPVIAVLNLRGSSWQTSLRTK